MRRLVVVFAGMLLGGVSPAAAQSAPHFDPMAFFAGRTEGTGRLKVLFSRGKPVRVDGRGVVEGDGTLVLDQQVSADGGPARPRQWRIRRIAPDTYAGTLTDAVGPVRMRVSGTVLRIAYHGKGGLAVRQRIMLEPGAEVAHNVLKVRKLGIVVATLRETIRHRPL